MTIMTINSELRGGAYIIDLGLLSHILQQQLGFQASNHFAIQYITTEHYMQAAKISFVTDHEAFPILEKQKEYPIFTPLIQRNEDGSISLVSIQTYQ